jgi:hypothetical protein
VKRFDDPIDKAIYTAENWYESQRSENGHVNTNVMTSGMAVAELLRHDFPLNADNVKSEKGSQVKGLSGGLAKKVLAKFGETRKFTSEGGRTSRGTLKLATELALALSDALEPFHPDAAMRDRIADELQKLFVQKVQEDYFNKQRLKVAIDPEKPVSRIVDDIFDVANARSDKPSGAVAQHLVGAKLELRFPNLSVGRDSANAADLQTDRQGDFQLGNTAFHVTVSPMAKLVERAEENLRNGFRPVVLVPEQRHDFAIGLFESVGLSDHVGVQSIETFVGANIEELAEFSQEKIKLEIALLIRKYNERIKDCERDLSLQIEEPKWIVDMLSSSTTYHAVKMQ